SGTGLGTFSLPVDRGRVVANPRWPQTGTIAGAANPAGSGRTGANTAGAAAGASPATPDSATTTTNPTVTAPRSVAAPTNSTAPSTATPSNSTTSITPGFQESLQTPEDFLKLARTRFEAGKIAEALSTLDAFVATFPAGSDEAWWLYGQIFESTGPQRDIKAALTFYKRLLAEYPQSSRYEAAQQRAAYLERFYFDIR
ncbi:MAG: tetratricopeptide repeat protein, partial [Termitinemataceae bacterium]